MKQLGYFGAIVLAALSSCALPAESSLSGTYRRDCAPYDGPAFIVVLPAPARNSEFWLRANVSLEEAAGNWRHSGLSQPGGAGIALCQTGSETKCDYPESGSFHIARLAGGKMNGSFEAHFSGGVTYKFNFVATPPRAAGKPVVCR